MKDITENKTANNIDFPEEITFKTIFRGTEEVRHNIDSLLNELNLKGTIAEKSSSKGKFISYTIVAVFPSNEVLQNLCNRISALEGFMNIF